MSRFARARFCQVRSRAIEASTDRLLLTGTAVVRRRRCCFGGWGSLSTRWCCCYRCISSAMLLRIDRIASSSSCYRCILLLRVVIVSLFRAHIFQKNLPVACYTYISVWFFFLSPSLSFQASLLLQSVRNRMIRWRHTERRRWRVRVRFRDAIARDETLLVNVSHIPTPGSPKMKTARKVRRQLSLNATRRQA